MRVEDGATGVARRIVRLFVLLGVVVAVYLVLSLFDHAARADVGSLDRIRGTDAVASVEAVASKVTHAPKVNGAKSTASKVRPQKIHKAVVKTSEVVAPKVKAHTKDIRAMRKPAAPIRRVGKAVQQVTDRTADLRRPVAEAVQDIGRGTVDPVLPPVKLPELAEPSALPQLNGPPQIQFPGQSRVQLSGLSNLPSLVQAHAPILARTGALSGSPVSDQQWSGQDASPQAQPRSGPSPAPGQQPAERSAPAGQVQNSGGGGLPSVGTVSKTWLPEMTAVGRGMVVDLIARGRTVRYAGPPS